MMLLVSFVPPAYHYRPASLGGNFVQIGSQRRISRMIAHIRADSQYDHNRPPEHDCHAFQISDSLHDIVFLVCFGLFRNQIVFPQIFFGPFQFYNRNFRLRRRSSESQSLIQNAPGRRRGHRRTVSVYIGGGNDIERILTLQCTVNILSCILRTI